jgi:hypothetical protein
LATTPMTELVLSDTSTQTAQTASTSPSEPEPPIPILPPTFFRSSAPLAARPAHRPGTSFNPWKPDGGTVGSSPPRTPTISKKRTEAASEVLMSRSKPSVKITTHYRHRTRASGVPLPNELATAVVIVSMLEKSGALDRIVATVPIRRRGYPIKAAVALLLLLFASGCTNKCIKRFRSDLANQAYLIACAAAAGLRSLPSNRALSGMLRAVSYKDVVAAGKQVLLEMTNVKDVVTNPLALLRDAFGDVYQLAFLDGTRNAYRWSPLPGGEQSAGCRVSARCAQPGFTGSNKRGEAVTTEHRTVHATGVVLASSVAPGNGDRRAGVAAWFDAMKWLLAASPSKTRAVVCADGEYGNSRDLADFDAGGIALVARWGNYQMLHQPEFRRQMATGTWYKIPRCVDGVERSAMNLGTRHLTDKNDESGVSARFVVCRYPHPEKTTRHGHLEDGWLYELLVSVGLDEERWSAPDILWLFHRRAAIENSFAQEDREVALDRTFSYSLGGQSLATLIGLFWMNWQLGAALRSHPIDVDLPPQVRREVEIDARPVPWANDVLPAEEPAGKAPETKAAPALSPLEKLEREVAARKQEQAAALAAFDRLAAAFPWDDWLESRPTWQRDTEILRCAKGVRALPTCLRDTGTSANLIFRVPSPQCAGCPLDATCKPGRSGDADRQLSISVPRELVQRLKGPMAALKAANAAVRHLEQKIAGLKAREARAARRPPAITSPKPAAPAPFAPVAPLISGGRMRAHTKKVLQKLEVTVHVRTPTAPRSHPFIVESAEDRRLLRLRAEDRASRFLLPKGSRVTMGIAGMTSAAQTMFPEIRMSRGASPPV